MSGVVAVALVVAASASVAPVTPGPAALSRLPEWAADAARAPRAAPPPGTAAHVLLQHAEIVYTGEGKVRVRTMRLVEVLADAGRDERAMKMVRLSGKSGKLAHFRAWNLRPDGEVEKLDRSDSVEIDFGWQRLDSYALQRVEAGSLLAFEAEVETRHPMGPVHEMEVLERRPVLDWSVEVRSEKPRGAHRLTARHLDHWCSERSVGADAVRLRNLPTRPEEGRAPHDRNVLPIVQVAFLDPSLPAETPSSATWDALASWIHRTYGSRAASAVATAPADPTAALRAIHDRLARDMVYRQVYLTPERGFVPLSAAEVDRRRYGDCKDLATWFIAQAAASGLTAYPVLARIVEGSVEEDEPPSGLAFNHAIVAVSLPSSAGLPAEVDSPRGRLLLVDPTARLVPLGRLPPHHRGRRLLVCTEVGAIWVTPPEAAFEPRGQRIRLVGALDAVGHLKGTLVVSDPGDGLREAVASGGRTALLGACARLGLAADAHCVVATHGDPQRLDEPFEVRYEIDCPQALRPLGGGEWALRLPGLPAPPPAPGRSARRLPIQADEHDSLDWEADLQLSRALQPVLPDARTETAFAAWTWTATTATRDPSTWLHARLTGERRAASFDFDRIEEGLAAWRSERAGLARILEDGLVLR